MSETCVLTVIKYDITCISHGKNVQITFHNVKVFFTQMPFHIKCIVTNFN